VIIPFFINNYVQHVAKSLDHHFT